MQTTKMDVLQMRMPTLEGSILISPGAVKQLAEHNISLEWLLQKHAEGHFACIPGGSCRDADGACTYKYESCTITDIEVLTLEGSITIELSTDRQNPVTMVRLADDLNLAEFILICPCAARKIPKWMGHLYRAINDNYAILESYGAETTSNASLKDWTHTEFTIEDERDIIKGYVITRKDHNSAIVIEEDIRMQGCLSIRNNI